MFHDILSHLFFYLRSIIFCKPCSKQVIRYSRATLIDSLLMGTYHYGRRLVSLTPTPSPRERGTCSVLYNGRLLNFGRTLYSLIYNFNIEFFNRGFFDNGALCNKLLNHRLFCYRFLCYRFLCYRFLCYRLLSDRLLSDRFLSDRFLSDRLLSDRFFGKKSFFGNLRYARSLPLFGRGVRGEAIHLGRIVRGEVLLIYRMQHTREVNLLITHHTHSIAQLLYLLFECSHLARLQEEQDYRDQCYYGQQSYDYSPHRRE